MRKATAMLMFVVVMLLGACADESAVSNSSQVSEEKIVTVFSSPT